MIISRRVVRAFPILILFGVACRDGGGGELAHVPFDAQAHVDAWVGLWNSYDLSELEDVFLWDSTATYLSSEREGLIRGPVEIREHHRVMGFVDGGKPPEQELWVEDVKASVYGTTAVVTAVWFFGDRAAPADSAQRGPMTIVYALADDQYRIAHMHFANY